VAAHSETIAASLNNAGTTPVKIVFKPTVKTTEEIYNVCLEANTSG
jgi:L-arabinose isomerase